MVKVLEIIWFSQGLHCIEVQNQVKYDDHMDFFWSRLCVPNKKRNNFFFKNFVYAVKICFDLKKQIFNPKMFFFSPQHPYPFAPYTLGVQLATLITPSFLLLNLITRVFLDFLLSPLGLESPNKSYSKSPGLNPQPRGSILLN